MDRGLELQNLLAKEGKSIVDEVKRQLNSYEEDKTFYYLAIGIELIITSKKITIHFIMPERTFVSPLYYCSEIINIYGDRHFVQNAISVYLVNHPDYSHEIDKDVDIRDGEAYSNSVLRFYFK